MIYDIWILSEDPSVTESVKCSINTDTEFRVCTITNIKQEVKPTKLIDISKSYKGVAHSIIEMGEKIKHNVLSVMIKSVILDNGVEQKQGSGYLYLYAQRVDGDIIVSNHVNKTSFSAKNICEKMPGLVKEMECQSEQKIDSTQP